MRFFLKIFYLYSAEKKTREPCPESCTKSKELVSGSSLSRQRAVALIYYPNRKFFGLKLVFVWEFRTLQSPQKGKLNLTFFDQCLKIPVLNRKTSAKVNFSSVFFFHVVTLGLNCQRSARFRLYLLLFYSTVVLLPEICYFGNYKASQRKL